MHIASIRTVTRLGTGVLAASVLAACASSTAPATSSAPDATATHARAAAVCTASNHALATAAQQTFTHGQPTAKTWRAFMLDTGLPLLQQRFQQLAAVDPADYDAINHAAQAAIRTARQHPTVLSPASRAPFQHVDALLTAGGLPACAVGG